MRTLFQWIKKIQKIIIFGVIIIGVFVTIINLFFYLTSANKPRLATQAEQAQNQIERYHGYINNDSSLTPEEKKAKIAGYNNSICKITGEQCANGSTKTENYKKSLLGGILPIITSPLENVPASGISYALYKLDNNDFLPSTYAYEGIGLASIKGYVKVWEVFRNFSYLVIVLFMILIGFLIMFRWQIGGQTLVTIENALPRLVITLILITLSFPIAGFMIDIMYISMGVFVYIVTSGFTSFMDPSQVTEVYKLDMVNKYIGAGFGDIYPYSGLWSQITSPIAVGGAIYNVLPGIAQAGLSSIVGAGINFIFIKLWTNKFGQVTDAVTNTSVVGGGSALGFGGTFGIGIGRLPRVLDFILSMIISAILVAHSFATSWFLGLLIILTLLFFLFRIFFLLLGAYIKIVLLIMFSPLILLFHIIPGKNAFGFWIKSLFGELIIFPLVAVVILTGQIIIGVNELQATPLFGLPFLHEGFTARDFGTIIGLGIVLMIPDLIKLAKGVLGIPDLGLDMGLGTFFSGVGAVGGGLQQGLGTFGSLQTLGHLPFLHNRLFGEDGKPKGVLGSIVGPTSASQIGKAVAAAMKNKD